MLVLAYDGSLNGDWVAHYAVRFAANTTERTLRLVHVRDGDPTTHLKERIALIGAECERVGVALELELLARGREGVADRILAAVPADPTTTIVCGTRARPRQHAFLAGTVSARLLQAARCRIVAIKVAHPGLLGQPGRVLLPVAGHPRGASAPLDLLKLLGPDLHHLHVLLVREVSALRFRILTAERTERMLVSGRGYVARLESDLRAGLAPLTFGLDSSVVVSDDVPREILVQAGKHRVRLVCLGASERRLHQRLVYGDPIELVLREATADVAVYRSAT